MVIKIYISGISGNKEHLTKVHSCPNSEVRTLIALISNYNESDKVKKRQQRVLMILESKNVAYEVIDITEPGKEAEKEFMQLNSIAKDSKYPLPPQIFNDEDYCGDYEDFDEANEMDELEKFLKGASISSADLSENKSETNDIKQNGSASSREPSIDKDATTIIDDEAQERRSSQSENNKNSDINEAENKDLTNDDDLEIDKSEKTDDISEDQKDEE